MIRARALAGALAAILLFPAGCAGPRPPSLALHLRLQQERVALVPDATPVEGSAELFARSRLGGALKGAGVGAIEGLGMLGSGSCSGESCGAVLVLGLAIAVVAGTTVGLAVGAARATPAEEAARIDASVHHCLESLPAHLDLSEHVLASAARESRVGLELVPSGAPGEPTLADLQRRGYASALQVGVHRIAFGGGSGSDPELALEIVASARLLDTASGETEYEREYRSVGVPRRFSAWAAGGGAPMRDALAEGLEALAETLASAVLAQADLGISGGTWTLPGTHGYGACWLTPLEPRSEYGFWSRELRWVSVPARRVRLRWEPFPSERQRAQLERTHGQAPRDVRYDVRVWEATEGERGALVHERRGLVTPEHDLDGPLAPAHRYFWSVRACFALGGGTACTPWAASLVPAAAGRTCESPEIPASNYYRFTTR